MSSVKLKCVLLADRHHGLTEGMRGLLESVFDAVVMVADQRSLLESASRLQPMVAVVDLSLSRKDSLDWLGQLRARCPQLSIVVLSIHDEPSVRHAALEAGAEAVVLKRSIATDLLPAIDIALANKHGIHDSGIPEATHQLPATPSESTTT